MGARRPSAGQRSDLSLRNGGCVNMSPTPIDLSKYKHTYHSERSRIVQALWFFVGLPLLRCQALPSSSFRRALLRLFGAKIGTGVVIKPGVRVKYPWLLRVGNHCWIGEDCWIDNLSLVYLGSSVCLSQGVYLCTGNHDWSDPAFGLTVGPIHIHDGAWICARAIIGPGTRIGEGAVLTAGSVATKSVQPYTIQAGNPAAPFGSRRLKADVTSGCSAAAAR
jgi:putative colanic acid biosynthesis acetyltransferase WcaF